MTVGAATGTAPYSFAGAFSALGGYLNVHVCDGVGGFGGGGIGEGCECAPGNTSLYIKECLAPVLHPDGIACSTGLLCECSGLATSLALWSCRCDGSCRLCR